MTSAGQHHYQFLVSLLWLFFALDVVSVAVVCWRKKTRYLYFPFGFSFAIIHLYYHIHSLAVSTLFSLAFDVSLAYAVVVMFAMLVILFIIGFTYNYFFKHFTQKSAKAAVAILSAMFALYYSSLLYNKAVMTFFIHTDNYAMRYVETDPNTKLTQCTASPVLYRKINNAGNVVFLCPFGHGTLSHSYVENFIPLDYYLTLDGQDIDKLSALNPKWNVDTFNKMQEAINEHLNIKIGHKIYKVTHQPVNK